MITDRMDYFSEHLDVFLREVNGKRRMYLRLNKDTGKIEEWKVKELPSVKNGYYMSGGNSYFVRK